MLIQLLLLYSEFSEIWLWQIKRKHSGRHTVFLTLQVPGNRAKSQTVSAVWIKWIRICSKKCVCFISNMPLSSVPPFKVNEAKNKAMNFDKEPCVSRDNPGKTHFAIREMIWKFILCCCHILLSMSLWSDLGSISLDNKDGCFSSP